jgi:tRNA(Ile)-lysidine synthetase-like protein
VPLQIDAAPGGAGRARIGGRALAVSWRLGAQEWPSPTGCAADAGVAASNVRHPGWSEAFDAGALCMPLVLRGWRPGDRIRLPYGSKKLKKLFGEMRLSREERSRTPVLAEGRDRVLWVVGRLRAVDAPPADPREILQITVCDG